MYGLYSRAAYDGAHTVECQSQMKVVTLLIYTIVYHIKKCKRYTQIRDMHTNMDKCVK